MKKLLSVVCALVMAFSLALLPCLAEANAEEKNISTLISEGIKYFPDGSSIVTQVFEAEVITSKGTVTKNGFKTAAYRDSNNNILCSFTIHGTFSVNTGVSATCTAASYSYTAPGSGWSLKTASATKSGSSAVGTSTFVKKVLLVTVDTRNLNCTLTCSKNGVLS